MKRKLRLSLAMCALLSISSLVNAQDADEAQLEPATTTPGALPKKTGYEYKQLDGYNQKNTGSGTVSGTAERAPMDFGGTKKAVPFDGGLTLLLAAGAGIAAKKKYDQKKKSKAINAEA